MKHDELMQFSLFDLFTDGRKIFVLKSLWRDFDLREAHKKKNICFVNKRKWSLTGCSWIKKKSVNAIYRINEGNSHLIRNRSKAHSRA